MEQRKQLQIEDTAFLIFQSMCQEGRYEIELELPEDLLQITHRLFGSPDPEEQEYDFMLTSL